MVYIYYDFKTKEFYNIYEGYAKFGTSNFAKNWKKAYFGNASGGISVFKQDYFINNSLLKKKIKDCDTLLNEKSNSWLQLIESIEKKLQIR
ncbi:hypothetical protein [Candidatus Uabimicrobium sp. HlEnr_7]|uniref:hypothetical protein n=1 Tax=Candidatus Uabimicrobium helgolandensis TaxID=3095367 RepID=UPI003557409B